MATPGASPTVSAATHSAHPTQSVVLAGAAAAVLAVVAVSVVALLGRALGVPSSFRQIQPASYVALVVVGSFAGAAGWSITDRRSRHPRQTLTRLVPVVLAISLVPDVALGIGGNPWGGVLTLMVMHLAVAGVALPVYARFMPVSSSAPSGNRPRTS